MTTCPPTHPVWVVAGVGPVAQRIPRPGAGERSAGTTWFEAAPAAVLTVAESERRLPDAALKAALEVMISRWGLQVHDVELLLVFAASFATAHTRRLVERVEDPDVRLRPRDSTDMETSESIRWTLDQLDRGVPRTTLILASPYDPGLVTLLAPPTGSTLVLRYDVWGPDPRQTDVLLTYCAARSDSDFGLSPQLAEAS